MQRGAKEKQNIVNSAGEKRNKAKLTKSNQMQKVLAKKPRAEKVFAVTIEN